ncbi:WDR17 [Branchiostoma lanceolatum]|uniref:WDR17 protein n=1 Tax=Branchiostoma lanceolatum TaxID=7740 RepID=A0A8K0A2M1_BRALA|nr:WDR17 [Branchiostoma lanceolatum]
MAMLKQVGLLAAGCQPWNTNVCSASRDRFAYCATLAIYIYQLDRKFNEFKLHSIMSEHTKTITAMAWHPRNPDILASASADQRICIWHVAEQRLLTSLDNPKGTPQCIDWFFHEADCLSYIFQKGPLYIWNYKQGSAGLSQHKEAHGFMYDVCQFRWHHRRVGKLVLGHVDGSLSLFSPGQKPQKHVLRPETVDETEEDDPVVALEWDPLSTEYLLVANSHFGVRLLDTEGLTVINTYTLPSAAVSVHTLAWVPTAPGMFVTGDTQAGVLRLWTVPKSTPLENIKVKKTGFHALHVLGLYTMNSHREVAVEEPVEASSTSSAIHRTNTESSTMPPALIVCTFLDGGVGLYNLARRKWDFLRDLGHIETIFDCKFKPDDPNLLATASFDGTIKVWDISTMQAVYTSPGNEGVIYSLSWAPADLNCVAASTSKQGMFIWDIGRGKVIKRFNEHGRHSIFCVAWNNKDSRRIATCGSDGHCVIRTVDGKLLKKYKHPMPVFGCDWSLTNKDMLATGCEDKNVRVFYLATNSDQPLKIFSGHTSKVFHVKWSPLREGILCSGSDDGTIRIWDYTQDSCAMVLSGHTAPVRGLLWNPEIPYLLLSGSWDYTIRVWDTRDGACIDTVYDHGADVYGLTCHPLRPFTVASCSRDSTVRIWSLTPLVSTLQISVIAKRPWTEIFAMTQGCGQAMIAEQAMAAGAPPLLSGRVSRDLRQRVEALPAQEQYIRGLQMFAEFFSPPNGTKNLWDLVSVIRGEEEGLNPQVYSKGIMHMKHLTSYKASEAQELEVVRMSKFGAGVGAQSREDRLRQAALIHVKLGNLQRYCELMVEVGEWEKALAVAPGVSMDYWRSLARRWAKQQVLEDKREAAPFCIAVGDVQAVVDFYTSRGELQDAMLVAQAAQEGTIKFGQATEVTNAAYNGVAEESEDSWPLLHKASRRLADWYFQDGQPMKAACCHLAVEDYKLAMSKLIRGNELELAISLGTTIGKTPRLTYLATELLAQRCTRINRCIPSLGYRDLAVEMLQRLPNSEAALARFCISCSGGAAEINDLHTKAGFPDMEECYIKAQALQEEEGQETEAVKYYLLSTCPEQGLELGLKVAKERMLTAGWTVQDVAELVQYMGCTRTDKLDSPKCTSLRTELLTISAYVGALLAVRRGYSAIVPALFQQTSMFVDKENSNWPFSKDQVEEELTAWKAEQVLSNERELKNDSSETSEVGLREGYQKALQRLLRKAGEEELDIEPGADHCTGSHLPSHSDVHVSFLSKTRIQGPAFFLEDGKTAISLNEALMWAKVNPFSPLGTTSRINPF